MKHIPYTCPQCGPDANGSNIHSETHHKLPLKTPQEALNTQIKDWKESKTNQELHEYIGWTKKQYSKYIVTGKLPNEQK